MMTLNKKQELIHNDVKWEQINKTSLLSILTVEITFLITITMVVIW